ncbi:ABC transporter substrate-binding protein [Reinekea blandensis]|uniref:sn-glycerol-3-phosphate-binding periplasmic protein UgpB n=1 Tax=Reinekea blandensis MED297 TaxID=314283 RepID=A4BGH7_9GAMM|nr:sugar ABC transporter substrate-binding protein [Reinekea blandensis]EAR08783.1 putative substrate binding protein [Reinekea sp. MED297] [Reinekea blandensis MED297]
MITRTLALASLAAGLGVMAQATEIRYVLWDSNQLPAYQQCAADFTAANPDITVKITQSGWDDYWTALSTGFVSGTAPDVFTNHLAKYPEFAKNNQLVDLSDWVARDGVDTSLYSGGLYDIWGRDAAQFGLPKDWDTIAMIVNMDMAEAAGITLEELNNMSWNPQDGGSFEQIVRKLTIDENGNNALSADFDADNVAVYGYQNPGSGGMMGQTEWGHFAVSNGFTYQPEPWDGEFNYDSPKLAETLEYLARMPEEGLSASFQDTRSLGSDSMFVAGKAAIVPNGSWMINYFDNNVKGNYQWIPLPIGPTGQRATMFNGLADSIWTGSKHKEEAWQWVKYLGSADCQSVVAEKGVVFPAIDGMAEKTTQAHQARGIDSSAFLTMANANTFLAPIADNGARINEAMENAVQTILLGKDDAQDALDKANKKILRYNR